MSAVIGALRADLSASIAQFEQDMGRAARAVGRFASETQRHAARISAAGRQMTIGLTAPIAAFGAASLRVAGDYEAAMNRVQAATGATADEMAAMREQARAFGRDRAFTATARDAANVMEILAKNGLQVTDIMGGATRATLMLAAATGAEFNPAADVATSVMQQFGRSASEMPGIVDGITGTLIQSRFGFEDYALAIGQAGGAAGGLGVSLEDFNTVLAATGQLFTSGSDAGTSFKTFLTSLSPTSREAAAMIERLDLRFFDASGNMRTMAEIAQELRDKLSGLSDRRRAEALQTIFGRDAMRTAIGLMNQGADGLERINRLIGQASARNQMEVRMRGLNGAVRQLRRSLEELFLKIAESGILEDVTGLVQRLSTLVDRFAALPPPVLRFATAIAGVVAAVGPLLVVIGWMVGAIANLAPLLPVLGRALAVVAGILAGPWGAAIAAAVVTVIAFKDQILALIRFLAGEVQRLLGPDFQRLMADFAQIWQMVATGPVAQAIGTFIRILGNLAAILLGAIGQEAIRQVARFLHDFERLMSGVVRVLEIVTAFVRGDWREAWRLMVETVDHATGGMATSIGNMVRDAMPRIRALWQGFKDWVADGITALLAWTEARFPGLVSAVRQAASGAIAWARNLYNGVANWIRDHLGPLIQWAIDRINDLDLAFATMSGRPAPQRQAPRAPPREQHGASGSWGRRDENGGNDDPLGNAAGAERSADRIAAARRRLAEALRDLNDQVAHGFDRQLPRSTQAAEELRRRIEDLSQDARDAGVNVDAFAGQIGALRSRIEELETEGLAREAQEFTREVNASGRAVREFASGGLAPLQERLDDVDRDYERLRERIEQQIEANGALAETNLAAAASMLTLRNQLLQLDMAHQSATASATAQYEAERRMRDLQSEAAVAQTRQQLQDLQQASGRGGFMTAAMEHLQAVERDLQAQRLAAATRLAEIQAELDEARRVGDLDAIARLSEQLGIQQQLYDLIGQTTAQQIVAAEQIQGAYRSFTEGLSDSLADMLSQWKFDLDSIANVFRQLARDLAQPFIDSAIKSVGSFISSAVSGGVKLPAFARGGEFTVGGPLGIDRSLVQFLATPGERVTITPRGEGVGGGRTIIQHFNISTPDANSFRRTERQIARSFRLSMAGAG